MMERRYRPWRRALWERVKGWRVLEVGVGTGKNMPYWPAGSRMTAIDLTPGMLKRSQARAQQLGLHADLRLGDVQDLDFPRASFDTAVATFVFCSVPDPVLGLRELARVVRPGGEVLLLEHGRLANPLLAGIMDRMNPLVVRLIGANINRDSLANLRASGLQLDWFENLAMSGMYKLIAASVP